MDAVQPTTPGMLAAIDDRPDATPEVASPEQTGALPDGERRCLVTGELHPKSELIRFVIGPDQAVYPDLAGKLPGRGLWVTADLDMIATAVRKNLFARAAKSVAKPAADLPDLVASLMKRYCLELLGLAKGAGLTILGQQQVEAALRRNTLSMLLMASDASDTLDGLLEGQKKPVRLLRSLSRQDLGHALGYAQIVYAGLTPHGLTKRLGQELTRLEKLTPRLYIDTING